MKITINFRDHNRAKKIINDVFRTEQIYNPLYQNECLYITEATTTVYTHTFIVKDIEQIEVDL